MTKGAAAASTRTRERSRLVAEATRRTARDSLGDSARALADVRLREARQTLGAEVASGQADRSVPPTERFRPDRGGTRPTVPPTASVDREARPHTEEQPARRPAGPPPSAPTPERLRAAKELVGRVRRNEQRGGERWRAEDVRRFASEDRELLRKSTDPADHAHRIGMERMRFEELRGGDRERAEAQIEKARRRDAQRLEVSTEPQGRAATERPRLALERVRQLGEGEAPRRREHLRSLRRERRSRDHLSPRRNLSRGA